jgi:erythronate-4-phosphate dehydrogenase
MKIVADQNIPFVKEAFSVFGEVITVSGRDMNRSVVANADALIVRSVTPVTRELLSGSSIKFVATATSGLEHIDQAYLVERGIGFAYAPGSNANSVAEYVLASIFIMAKKLHRKPSEMVAGIIGVGNIGTRLHTYLEALGIPCLLNDPPKKRMAKSGGAVYRSLEEVLEASDIVTLHVPLETGGLDPTYHMVDNVFLQRMKQGAVLINACRGKTMIDESLLKYRDKLGGLVLDVWNNEPAVDPVICSLADLATPHVAGYSFDGKINGTAMIYKATCAFFGMPEQWGFGKILGERGATIDCAFSPDPVFDALVKTVPIQRDSATLKKIGLMAAEEHGNYFDSLRTNYPIRLECSHFSVVCDTNMIGEAALLRKLGFAIVDSPSKPHLGKTKECTHEHQR